ncbi:unnamed protein product [Rotaria sordida]|uniref:Uncharacterized protein n=1 Tax=Rotaria sordida TaxID=392033 RepID=A0A815WGC9_9BILA|nr:unnamed protein product [Rotaria sordida]
MKNTTRSHLNLQQYHISDLIYCPSSRIRRDYHYVCEQSRIRLLSQQNSLITMSTSQPTSESVEEQKTCGCMAQLDIKSNLQLLRE